MVSSCSSPLFGFDFMTSPSPHFLSMLKSTFNFDVVAPNQFLSMLMTKMLPNVKISDLNDPTQNTVSTTKMRPGSKFWRPFAAAKNPELNFGGLKVSRTAS
jgi:hypothetical protein